MSNQSQKGGPLAKLAAIFADKPEFRAFLNERLPNADFHIGTAAKATEQIKLVCCVDSRIAFDNDPDAAERFHELVRRPYVHWQLCRDSE